jgi:hypothetical protein
MIRYTKNGEDEKKQMTKQFNDWVKDMTGKLDMLSQTTSTIDTLKTSIEIASDRSAQIADEADDEKNQMNLSERKIHFTGQVIKAINGIEYYVKLVYWLAFLTWIACVIYDRALTMKTAVLFVVFTVIALLQDQIMDAASALISTVQ